MLPLTHRSLSGVSFGALTVLLVFGWLLIPTPLAAEVQVVGEQDRRIELGDGDDADDGDAPADPASASGDLRKLAAAVGDRRPARGGRTAIRSASEARFREGVS